MSNHVWYLTSPDGRVVGASSNSSISATYDAYNAGQLSPDILQELHVKWEKDPTATRYEAAGYVLARGEVAAP